MAFLDWAQEEKGGRAYQKLGFVDIDLAQFAGCGLTTRRYLLEGYNEKKHRQDNSTLKVQIDCTLITGDPLFKRPSKTSANLHVPSYGSATNSKDNTMNSRLDNEDLVQPVVLGEDGTSLGENNNLVSCSDNNNTLFTHSPMNDDLKTLGHKYPIGLLDEDYSSGTATGTVNGLASKHADDCQSGESVSSGFGSLPRSKHEQKRQSNGKLHFENECVIYAFFYLIDCLPIFDQDNANSDDGKESICTLTNKSNDNTATNYRQSSAEEGSIAYVHITHCFVCCPFKSLRQDKIMTENFLFSHRENTRFGSSDKLKQFQQNTLPPQIHVNSSSSRPQYATLQPSQRRLTEFSTGNGKLFRPRVEYGDNVNTKVDATRVDCEDIVNEIIESQLRETNDNSFSQEAEFGLELVVAKDGTAKLGSKAITRTRKSCSDQPASKILSHSNPNTRPNSEVFRSDDT